MPYRERQKKADRIANDPSEASAIGATADSLEAFFERLRNLCENNCGCHGPDRSECIQAQAKQAVSLAAELGYLKEADCSWVEFQSLCPDIDIGTEHMVDLDERAQIVGKTTLPPAFGLVPEVVKRPLAVLTANHPHFSETIEFVNATPLEYLARWLACNEVFGDDVRLASVIRWNDGLVSFGITQPHYHGVPAEQREIEQHFLRAGWTRLNDPSGHTIFFNHAFRILAIDVERRNCFINEGLLLPFDVILRKPDERLERYLQIYPE